MKQTLVLDAETFNATTVPINCAGCYIGLTVLVPGDGDNHVTVYPEVSFNHLDFFPLTYAFIDTGDADLMPDGLQMVRSAITLNVKPFKAIRVRINGGNGVDTIPVAIEMVARS